MPFVYCLSIVLVTLNFEPPNILLLERYWLTYCIQDTTIMPVEINANGK